jgi:hypothetical protein
MMTHPTFTHLWNLCQRRILTLSHLFLCKTLKKKMKDFPDVKQIILLSDAVGRQNKNATMMRFCSFFARLKNVEITQLFPVRGHLFGQCDQNFGLIRTRIKNLETAETPMEYLAEMVRCRSIHHILKFCLTGKSSETGKRHLKTVS